MSLMDDREYVASEHKGFSPKTKAKTTKNKQDSITGVNPERTHGFGVYKGRRKVWGVRVDETLLKQAKPVLKAKFGSECRGVEAWLAGLVAITKGEQLIGVNPSNTVEIGKLIIERNLRPRRKLDWEPSDVGLVDADICGVCKKPLGDDARKVEYISGKFDVLCPGCYKIQRERHVVERGVGRLVSSVSKETI